MLRKSLGWSSWFARPVIPLASKSRLFASHGSRQQGNTGRELRFHNSQSCIMEGLAKTQYETVSYGKNTFSSFTNVIFIFLCFFLISLFAMLE